VHCNSNTNINHQIRITNSQQLPRKLKLKPTLTPPPACGAEVFRNLPQLF
jgi:hypothetical protein